MKSVFKRCALLLAVLFLLFSSVYSSAYASSIADWRTDSETGWVKWYNRHMGTKYTTYSYESASTKAKYKADVDAGIAKWGVAINCQEVATGAMGLIKEDIYYDPPGSASVQTSYDANKHITSWVLTIYSALFPYDNSGTGAPASAAGKNNTIAHEIGHVYGLGEISNSSQIMYGTYSETKTVTLNDRRGMHVMTHQHQHNASTSYIILTSYYNTHDQRCLGCCAIVETECFTSEWHSGNRHYFVNDCACGNTGTVSIVCNAADCPYS